MTIAEVKVLSTEIPVVRPHKMNIGTTSRQELTIVQVATDEGIVGLGEAPFMVGHSQAGETPGTVRAVLRDKLVPAVLGRDPTDIEGLQVAMDRAVPGNNRAKSALNLAAYDIVGKALGVSVSALLGGRFRSAIPLSWSLPIAPFEEIVREAEQMCERGFTILKVKAGRPSWRDDVEAVRRVRGAVGDAVHIRVDANQAYDVRTAIRAVNAMEEFGLEFMEQPVQGWDLAGMAEVRAATRVPIMADESIRDIRSVHQIALTRAADYLSIYVCNPGGLLNAKKIAAAAEVAGLVGYVGGALESPVGSAAGLHLAASSPGIRLGCEMSSQFLLADSIGTRMLAMRDGCLVVPDGPGLGVELDWEKVERYKVGPTEVFEAR